MTDLSPEDLAVREEMVQAVMKNRGCAREEAEVIMKRIADRLGGYTHDEVVRMHPLPPKDGRDG